MDLLGHAREIDMAREHNVERFGQFRPVHSALVFIGQDEAYRQTRLPELARDLLVIAGCAHLKSKTFLIRIRHVELFFLLFLHRRANNKSTRRITSDKK